MSEEGKKISFGFSKLSKAKVSIIGNKKELKKEESVQFIDCVEDKSIKVKDEKPKEPEFLVIPLPKQSSVNVKNSDLLNKILKISDSDGNLKLEKSEDKTSSSIVSDVPTSQLSNKLESLDEIAAREIIEDSKKVKAEKEELNNFTVPLTANVPSGEKESTLDDYDSIPVDKFGMAMLRGMGWLPGKGIGKNEKVVDAKQPVLRPKGLGLGADKVIKKEESVVSTNEPIKLVKGSCVRIIAGTYKDSFGEVIGFDEEAGRLIVKMTLGGSVLTFNEFMVQPVSKEEFSKNSRVINVKKYEEYKSKENTKGVIDKQTQNTSSKSSDTYSNKSNERSKYKSYKYRRSSESSNDSTEGRKVKTSQSSKYRPKANYSPDNSSKEEYNSRKCRRSSSSSSNDCIEVQKSSSSFNKNTSYKQHSRSKYSSPSNRNTYKSYSRHSSLKESSKKKNRSSSDNSSPTRSNSRSYDRHVSRKDVSKNKNSRLSSSSPAEIFSSSRHKSSRKNRKRSNSSDSDHSHRRNDASHERKHSSSKSYKKQKKSKKSKYK